MNSKPALKVTTTDSKRRVAQPSKTLRQLVSFGLVGASGLIVGLGVLNIVMLLKPNFVIANIIAFFFAASWNFLLNRKFTFSRIKNRSFVSQWIMFLCSSILGALFNWMVSFSLYYGIEFFHRHYNVAALCGISAGYIINFMLAKYIVFKPSVQSSDIMSS